MRRLPLSRFAFSFLSMLSLASVAGPVHAQTSTPKTIFDHAEKAWAIGRVHLQKEMPFREGKVLVFPAQVTELAWAPRGTKPRNMMLVYELSKSEDPAKPFLKEKDEVFGVVQLLPDHSYWKDNLPNTRRHAFAGGRRYIFRDDDIPEVETVLREYGRASELPGKERWSNQLLAVTTALMSKVVPLREDAVQHLANKPQLLANFDPEALPAIRNYLDRDVPEDEKARLIDLLVAAKVEQVRPDLEKLAKRDDATGAAAMVGLEGFGQQVASDKLVELSRAKSPGIRAYSARTLASRAGTDEKALARAREILKDEKEETGVRAAAAEGFAKAGGEVAVKILADALRSSPGAAQPTAEALAAIATEPATAALAKVLQEESGEVATAAAAGLFRSPGCRTCGQILAQQWKNHPDEEVRHLIGVMLEVPLEHKH
jgi:hypothetical protein